ncbi:MAG: hypothetical protein F7C08_01580 [Desulfurococcales archaeon]|nr:hypothetical protein [Desulfurococcales archaeon]MCE4605210.1 hypothetical protein [Desulfurococcales archaeon]
MAGRGDQGVVVSVAILTAATLVMALAIYSYFTSHYAESSLESKLELVKTRALGSISLLYNTFVSVYRRALTGPDTTWQRRIIGATAT